MGWFRKFWSWFRGFFRRKKLTEDSVVPDNIVNSLRDVYRNAHSLAKERVRIKAGKRLPKGEYSKRVKEETGRLMAQIMSNFHINQQLAVA